MSSLSIGFNRAERHSPKVGEGIGLYRADLNYLGELHDISTSGLLFASAGNSGLSPGVELSGLILQRGGHRFECGSSVVARVAMEREGPSRAQVALKFDVEQSTLVNALMPAQKSPGYANCELRPDAMRGISSTLDATEHMIDEFYNRPSQDILEKCASFRPWVDDLQKKKLYQRMWRVTLTSGLDHQITVFDPILREERRMVCFDSNSYLGLHNDPRVIERTVEVLRQVGYGTPSAQLLGGTNSYLRELEQDLSDFLGREETMVFPTGFAANVGTLAALVRKNDAVVRDRLSHASIQEGCRGSRSRFSHVFAHNDMASLASTLEAADQAGCDGKLIVTDGVFSMHGRLAPLPELVQVAKRYSARLMLDDAHGLGVLGQNGRGLEEHFDMAGSVDVLMGTLSKALGAMGGFVSGSRDLVNYLRFYAPSGMFTTALPAATCAGIREALRILKSERHHQRELWENIHFFVPALAQAGFIVPDAVSPIVTVFMGNHKLMLDFSRELFDAGVKCGNVMYPAVAKGAAILRFTINARHTRRELQYTIDTLVRVGKKWGILHRSETETCEIGARARLEGKSSVSASTLH